MLKSKKLLVSICILAICAFSAGTAGAFAQSYLGSHTVDFSVTDGWYSCNSKANISNMEQKENGVYTESYGEYTFNSEGLKINSLTTYGGAVAKIFPLNLDALGGVRFNAVAESGCDLKFVEQGSNVTVIKSFNSGNVDADFSIELLKKGISGNKRVEVQIIIGGENKNLQITDFEFYAREPKANQKYLFDGDLDLSEYKNSYDNDVKELFTSPDYVNGDRKISFRANGIEMAYTDVSSDFCLNLVRPMMLDLDKISMIEFSFICNVNELYIKLSDKVTGVTTELNKDIPVFSGNKVIEYQFAVGDYFKSKGVKGQREMEMQFGIYGKNTTAKINGIKLIHKSSQLNVSSHNGYSTLGDREEITSDSYTTSKKFLIKYSSDGIELNRNGASENVIGFNKTFFINASNLSSIKMDFEFDGGEVGIKLIDVKTDTTLARYIGAKGVYTDFEPLSMDVDKTLKQILQDAGITGGAREIELQFYVMGESAKITRIQANYEFAELSRDIVEFKIFAGGDQTTVFAANQLKKYVKLMTGNDLGITSELTTDRLIILANTATLPYYINEDVDFSGLKYDGFMIKQTSDDFIITSNYSRGVLFGVYDLLEKAGCRWVKGGNINEYVPRVDKIELSEYAENPDMEIRSYTNSPYDPNAAWVKETTPLVDWAAKNKMNSLFLHMHVGWGVSAANLDMYNEAKKRGMLFEMGGHGAENYVRRDLFIARPELFRMVDGVRRKDGNFCATNADAVQMVIDGLTTYLNSNKGIDIFHFWFDDVTGNSWCECDRCKVMTPLQQQNYAISQVGKAIQKTFPDIMLDMLLYHKTIENIDTLSGSEPPLNVYGFYAPRERCYVHSINDSACEANKLLYKALKDTVKVYGNNSYAFEYYSDCILYSKNTTNFAKTIAQDMKDYLSAGVNKITTLSFGDYSFLAYSLNLQVFAEHSWNSSLNVDETISRYIGAIGFTETAQKFKEYTNLKEQISANTYGFCDYGQQYTDIRELPFDNLQVYGAHIEKLKTANQKISLAGEALAELKIAAENEDNAKLLSVIEAEQAILHITELETEAVYNRMYFRYTLRADPTKHTYNEFKAIGQKVLDNQTACKQYILKLPLSIKGLIADATCVTHLCDDQYNLFNAIMQNELSSNPEYHTLPQNVSVVDYVNPSYDYANWKMSENKTSASGLNNSDGKGYYNFNETQINVKAKGDFAYIYKNYQLDLSKPYFLALSVDSGSEWAVKAAGSNDLHFVAQGGAGKKEVVLNLTKFFTDNGLSGTIVIEVQLVNLLGGASGTYFSGIRLLTDSLSQEYKYVNITASAGGKASGGGNIVNGSAATLTATANAGYKFTGWYKNNALVSQSAEYKFDVSENVSLNARFEYIKHTINFAIGENGSISCGKETVTVSMNDNFMFYVVAYNGYKIKQIKVNGAEVEIPANCLLTFENITEDLSIEVAFDILPTIAEPEAPVSPDLSDKDEKGCGKGCGAKNNAVMLFTFATIFGALIIKRK